MEKIRTWHDVSQSNGGHGDEAEVERLEERPALPDGEDEGADAEEEGEECQGEEGGQQI